LALGRFFGQFGEILQKFMGIEQAIIKDAFTKGEELGLRKGEELGEEKHARKSIKRMLAKGVDDATIREFLGVEQALIDEVRGGVKGLATQ
jgi:helix-turn-helix protein